jgi:hypothetical protein
LSGAAYCSSAAAFSSAAQWRHQRRGPKYVKYGRSIIYTEAFNKEWFAAQVVDPKRAA